MKKKKMYGIIFINIYSRLMWFLNRTMDDDRWKILVSPHMGTDTATCDQKTNIIFWIYFGVKKKKLETNQIGF